ncbi:MAG: Delta-60 repeat-containing protein [Fluviicola sp.]|jgi:uncharacterized delta-60 repeat protein|uniref:T9SS type A sorting domain-containing protein n=1 Tax=Fluviicola sp. TaxID=1917219 RepID=UPI002602F543|nr:T9SS type A sorting domain-containing protein [Fluviicola sp.]MDF3025864.1 Delta-60 repeat-containing protein [Fluviicola sp.]
MRTIITPIAFFCCLAASAQNITLNGQFGYEGFTYVENTTSVRKIALNPDGSIISAGNKSVSGGSNIVLTKHDAGGIQDLTFGSNGIAFTAISVADEVRDIQLQADGKILVSGSTYTGSDSGPGVPILHAFVVRYHPNGVIDSSFATNGIFRVTDYNQSEFSSIIVQSDESLRLIGYSDNITYMTKLTSAGMLDSSFGTNGYRALSDQSTFFFFNSGSIRLNDGSILSYGLGDTGLSNPKFTCIKTDASGDLITSFGQNGITTIDFSSDPNSLETVSKAQELPDGRIVLAGETISKALIRLKADGTLDSTFATNGILVHSLPYMDMVVQPNGKILIGGSREFAQFNWGIVISRFNTDGTIDNSFNTTGSFECDFSTGFETMGCMILTAPDRLLVGGKTDFIQNTSDFLLTEIDMSQSLNLQTNQSDKVTLYPNPVSDELTISVSDESITSIQLTDASGRLISSHVPEKHTSLSLAHLPAGLYQVIFVNDAQERISKKLIKQ